MDLTKLQLSELMCKHAAKGNGLAKSTGGCEITEKIC